MAYAKLLLVLALAAWANGHSYFSSITIDGVAMKEDDCMRPHPSSKYDYPISALDNPNGLQSTNMICGFLPAAGKAANRKCPVKPGSTVTLQWHYERGMGSSDTFFIDPSHKGPCIVYMAKSETGTGNVWFKIFEDGYDTASKKWCVTRMRENGGKFTVTIPTDIQPGNYLFRGELIALHEGHEMYGAQPYVGCAELTVSGSGTVDPPNKVTFPGAYKATDAGIFFNPYRSFSSYPIPGPAKYVSGSAPAAGGSSSSSSSTTGRSTSTSTSTTGRATSTSTTGRATSTSTTTTGRATSTSTSSSGRTSSSSSSSTTGQKTSTSTSGSSSSGGSYTNPTGSCTLGEQVCTGDATYKTCGWVGNGVAGWGTAQQNCPSGLKCHAVQDKYVWCY